MVEQENLFGKHTHNMYKDNQLTISDWQKGMVKHPIMGFGLVENADLFKYKGLLKSAKAFALTNKTLNNFPIAYQLDVYGNEYWATYQTANGNVYKNSTAIISSLAGLITDIKIYKDYLWVKYSSNIGCYGPLNNSPQWFPTVITGLSTNWGQMVVGQDDYLYVTNGNYVSKIDVSSSGTAGVAPTASITTSLDLPDGQIARCITEFGTKIAIGTEQGKLFTWNRQAGTLGNPGLADLPVNFNENGVWQLLSHKNTLYVVAGKNGNVYVSDGTNYRKLVTIPFNEQYTTSGGQIAYLDPFVTYYPNAIAINDNGNLLIGNVSNNTVAQFAVWEISDTGEVVLHKLSTGKTTSTIAGVGFIYLNTSSNHILAGWYNGNSEGIDETSTTNTTVTVETPLYKVGRFNFKKSFEHIEFNLATPMSANNTITISYRKNRYEDYTEIGTWDYATYGAITSFEDTAGIADCEFIQLKIETFGTELLDIILR